MSDWSSYTKNKKVQDNWRDFLKESLASDIFKKGTSRGYVGDFAFPDSKLTKKRIPKPKQEPKPTPVDVEEDPPYTGVEDELRLDTNPGEWSGAQPPVDLKVSSGEPEQTDPADPKEKTITTRLKDVFGGVLDVGGLASFFPGIGQAIGGATTAASLINNLTYDPPKYAWAAVDLAALSVAFLPGGTGLAKGSKIAMKLQKAAKASKGAQQAGKVAKAGTGALTIQQELKAGLPEDAYNAVMSALAARNKDGSFVAGVYLQRLRAAMANKFGEDSKAVEIVDGFKTQILDLQREVAASGSKASSRTPEAQKKADQERKKKRQAQKKARRRARRNENKEIISEATAVKWQELAGIKKRVL